MPNLMDISPPSREVKTSFGEVRVPGISLTGLVTVIKKHPELVQLFKDGELPSDLSQVMDLGIDIAASFMAAGLGYPGEADAEQRCRQLKPEDAWDLGKAILEESFPGGPKGFFDKIQAAMEAAGVRVEGVSGVASSS